MSKALFFRQSTFRDAPRVAIIGGGFGGIAAAIKLKRAGFENFVILEQSEGFGGTWWDNRYPGAECDVPSVVYSYSFHRYPWTRTHARQQEIWEYIADVVDRFGLHSAFRFASTVRTVRWNESTRMHDVTLSNGETTSFHVVISAVGLLNVPTIPPWAATDDFAGDIVHSSRWKTFEFAGKHVGVVGTGSTAVQIVSEIAPFVANLTVFQREPGWVLGKGARDYTTDERATLAKRSRYIWARVQFRWANEKALRGGKFFHPGSEAAASGQAAAVKFLHDSLPDRPDLIAKLTPTYPFPGKRPVYHDTYFKALSRDNVSLVPSPVTTMTTGGAIDATGAEHPLDVMILATGFQAAKFLHTFDVYGTNGASLHEQWGDEPTAFLGVCVPHIPNFFMLYGPNTNGGEIIPMLENGAAFAVRTIRSIGFRRTGMFVVRGNIHDRYNRWLDGHLRSSVWASTNNYFRSSTGRVVTQWPFGTVLYGLLLRLARPSVVMKFPRRRR